MKTTYYYYLYARMNGRLVYVSQHASLEYAKVCAFDLLGDYVTVLIVRVPDHGKVALSYVPRCWEVVNLHRPELQEISVIDFIHWI